MTAAYFEDHPTDPDKVILRKPKHEDYKREWVGLTPEEVLDLFDVNNVYGSKWIEFARTVENKLKEKNG